jgi:YcxB-like protein
MEKWTTRFVLGIGLISFVIFLVDLFVINRFNGYILLYSLLFVFLQPLFHCIYAIQFYNSSSFIKKLSTYKIDETGVELTSESANIVLKWQNVYKIKETNSLFLLYENKFQAHYIPKQDMTAEQITALQALLKTIPLQKK